MLKRIIIVVFVGLVLALGPAVDAAVLPNPTITDYATPFNIDYYDADNVFDEALGVSGNLAWLHGGDYATQNGSKVNAYIDFDFGSAKYITEFHFWDRARDYDSLAGFELILDNDSDFSSPIQTFTFGGAGSDFAHALGTDGDTAPEEIFTFASAGNSKAVSGITARYVKWRATAIGDVGNSEYEGATEIRFHTPEPCTLGLLSLGGLALVRRRTRGMC